MKDSYTRREALGLGLGAVAIGTAATSFAAAQTVGKPGIQRGNTSAETGTYNTYGEQLETSLLLRTSPVAVKMLEREEDIPVGAFRPKKDGGIHIAQCQAFGMSRREGKTVAMLKEDHWCPTALTAYGMVEKLDSGTSWGETYKSFPTGQYIGVLTAPLKKAAFVPDVVLIYSNPAQLRGLLLPMMFGGSEEVNGHFFLPSCGHCVVDPIQTGNLCVVLPDPGEYQRALTLEEEIIFAVPKGKIQNLMAGLTGRGRPYSHRDQYMSMLPDFEQPQFYKDMFKSWGLDSE